MKMGTKKKEKQKKVFEIMWNGEYAGARRSDPSWEYRLEGQKSFDRPYSCHLHELLKIFHNISPLIPVASILKATETPEIWVKVRYPKQAK